MRPVWVVTAFLAACTGGGGSPRPPATPAPDQPGELAADDVYVPTYGKAELQRALIAERGAEATGERQVADLETKLETKGDPAAEERLIAARADLEVRRRFIRSLEACEASGRACPPRLDDPPFTFDIDPKGAPTNPRLDTEVRFDLASWQKLTDELFGRACACRTLACIDAIDAAANYLETRPMPEVQGDEAASRSLMRARECLFRLRGKTATPGGPAPSPADD